MDCTDCNDKLYAYLDRELSPIELTEVRAHLDACGGCEDQFVVEERFLKHVRDCCTDDTAPLDLRSRIIARLRRELDASL